MSIKAFQGSKKSQQADQQKSADPDTFFTNDSIEIILGLTEGEIKGLKDNSAQNFYVGDTPLLNATGTSNFEAFQLQINNGTPFGELIFPRLGGGTSSISVGTDLASRVPVIRQGQLRNIDWLELRFAVNGLYSETGTAAAMHIQVEYKPVSSRDWMPAILYRDPGLEVQTGTAQTLITQAAAADRGTLARRQMIYSQITPPVLSADVLALSPINGQRIFWLNGNPNQTRVYRAGDWYTPEQLDIDTSEPGQIILEFTDANYVRVVEPNRGHIRRRLYLNPAAMPRGPMVGDLWFGQRGSLWYNGSAWVDLLPPVGDFDPVRGEILEATNGAIIFVEKISSTAVKELRVRVPRIDEPYQVRCTKITPDSDGKSRGDVNWESIQEINSDPLIFPNLATAHLFGRASDQFSSIPDFWGIYQGRMIRVPSNYDTENRVYEGVWDGGWKIAYSNNPAYVVYDLVMNDRYGICSAYPVELDPYDVYLAGNWCDLRVGENNRPQFTFNGLIAEARSAREAVTFVAGIFGGRYFDDGNGYARLKIDKNDPAVHLFTKEKVEGGVFTYGYSEMETRKNDYTVAFINPDLGWKEDRRRVYDTNHIQIYGRVPEDFIATGCTNAEEAIARARLKLISDMTEKETVTFSTNRIGLYLEPYDIFLVADDAMDDIVTGRIEGRGPNWLDLRDPVYLEAGFAYKIVLSGIIDGKFGVHELVVAAASTGKTTTRILCTSAIPADVPEQANFAIDTGTVGRPYRLLSISETEGNPDKVQITGIQVNRLKWEAVHSGDSYVEVEIPKFESDLSPVQNLRVIPRIETLFGRPSRVLTVSWDRHPNKFVRRYELYWNFNGGSWNSGGEFAETSFELTDVKPGVYVFSVRALSFTGQKSIEAFCDIDLRGSVKDVNAPINLQLVNRTEIKDDISIFESAEARYTWEQGGSNPDFSSYDVLIYDDKEELVRTDAAGTGEYTYSSALIQEDEQTRNFSFGVRSRDIFGNKSDETRIFCYNPAPPVLSPSFVPVATGAQLYWKITQPLDYAGTLIWVSDTPGVDVTREPDFDVTSNTFTVPLEGKDYRWVVMAGYDFFGRYELNYSSELMIYDLDFEVDFDAPDIPTGFVISSSAGEDGSVLVSFDWNENAEEDLAGYRLQVREPGGNYVQFRTDTNHYELLMKPGLMIEAVLAAYDRSSNMSPNTDMVTHTAAADTIPPETPTGLKVTTSFISYQISWDDSAEVDMRHYELEVSGGEEPVTYISVASLFNLLGDEAQETRSFRVRAIDTSGNASDWSEAVEATLAYLDINATQLAAPVIVDVLPDPIIGTTPKKVYLKTDGRFYVQRDGKWVDETSATLITGQIVEEQIADLQISKDKLGKAAVDRSKLTFGAVGMTNIGTGAISSPKMRANAVTAKKLRAGSILSHHLTVGVILAQHMDVDSVTAQAIQTGTLLARHFTSESVTTEALQARVITADKLAVQNVITLSAQIANAIIGDAHIDSLSATKIRAGTALLGSVTVNGEALSTTTSNAKDPAARINAASTMILPGKISLNGSTSLTSWIFGGDNTSINGGAIAANTIKANSVEIGMRGLAIEGLEFEDNKPEQHQLAWTMGTIGYVNDAGETVRQEVATGGATWTGKPMYVVWPKGGSALQVHTDIKVALVPDNVILAVYRGFNDLVATYGRTVIDGGTIKTDSITANQLKALSIDTRHLKASIINSTHIQAVSIGAAQINTQNLAADTAFIGDLTARILKANAIQANMISVAEYGDRMLVNGQYLSTVASNALLGAQDPLTRITTIGPGKIEVADYGSKIYANGVPLSQIQREANSGAAQAFTTIGPGRLEVADYSQVITSGGYNLAQIRNGAVLGSQDPAHRINNGTTTIEGGIIRTGSISAEKIAAYSISTDRLIVGGVDMTALANGAASAQSAGAGYDDVSMGIDVRNGIVIVQANSGFIFGAGFYDYTIYRDGGYLTQVRVLGGGEVVDANGNRKQLSGQFLNVLFTDAPGVGWHTYRIVVTGYSGGPTGQGYNSNGSIVMLLQNARK